jgi:branched-chain amino acid transport system permease protein
MMSIQGSTSSSFLNLKTRAQVKTWEWVGLVLILASPWVFVSHAMLLNEIAVTALFAVSLDLILGYSGIVSLGHAAFFGWGCYSAGLFAKLWMPDPILGLLLASASGALLGLMLSLTVLRGTDLTRIMVTLGVSLIGYELANRLSWLTGGADGLQGVLMGPVLGQFEFDLIGQVASVYSVTTLVLVLVLLRRVVYSPFGVGLTAIRDNRLRSESVGLPVARRLMVIYSLAAAVAALAGALLAQTTGFASLDVFSFERSADVLLMLVIGGAGWLYGGVVGALVFKLIQQELSSITPQYWMFWIGFLLIILVMVGREKLFSPLRRFLPGGRP